jgi:hypothetical protein
MTIVMNASPFKVNSIPIASANCEELRLKCLEEFRLIEQRELLHNMQNEIAKNILVGRRASLIISP